MDIVYQLDYGEKQDLCKNMKLNQDMTSTTLTFNAADSVKAGNKVNTL